MSNVNSLSTHHSSLITRRYGAVFLDAQGTLLQAHPSVPAIYARVCRRFGRRARASEIAVAARELWAEFKLSARGQDDAHDTSDEATREWWADFNTRLLHRLGVQQGLEPFLQALWDDFGRPQNWRLFPDVKEVLEDLRARGYRLGVVSNWDSRLISLCKSLGLTARVDFILASAETGMEKPDRRIFEMALARAGVEPHRAVHVGDDYEADVLGARGAGIDAVLIDRVGRPPVGEPAIRSLEDLLQILP